MYGEMKIPKKAQNLLFYARIWEYFMTKFKKLKCFFLKCRYDIKSQRIIIMTDTTPQQSTTNTDYGDVLHSTILKIFGDELTYNELEPYTIDKDDYSHLEVKEERNNHVGFMFISVFVDKHKIMEKKYDVNWSCDMFNYLSELENEKEEEEEEEEDEDEE